MARGQVLRGSSGTEVTVVVERLGLGDRRGGTTNGWIWEAFAAEPRDLADGLDVG